MVQIYDSFNVLFTNKEYMMMRKEKVQYRYVLCICCAVVKYVLLLASMSRILWTIQIVFSFQPADGAVINFILPKQAI